MKMMVYCKLISHNGNSDATYAFGAYESDMTGRITFYSDGRTPLIGRHPDSGHVSNLWIGKLLQKYSDALKAGTFKEKMAYEC